VRRIAKTEGLTVTDAAMNAIVYIAEGDMRRAINALQGAAIISPAIDEQRVYAITATARPEEIEELLTVAISCDFEAAELAMKRLITERGIAPQELLGQAYRALVRRSMDKTLKVRLIDALGETDFRLSEGADAEIQMEALVARMVLCAQGSG
jgi:replication factor C small subunit